MILLIASGLIQAWHIFAAAAITGLARVFDQPARNVNAPMRYAVDLVRGLFYRDSAEYGKVVLQDPATDLGIMGSAFIVFMIVGTALFVRAERNR